jgi:hypothetical protein
MTDQKKTEKEKKRRGSCRNQVGTREGILYNS